MNFSGFQYPKDVILQVVRYYVSYKLSYRDIEEIFTVRGIEADHSTYNRWVIRFAPQIEMKARQKKGFVAKNLVSAQNPLFTDLIERLNDQS
ncbi:hypothetical protein [Aliivibrio wodanis]|uniref:hypothetical protein n=1 Tax=Aliivibrio wodanis TaxID=80852 RepID=UPI00406D296D